MVVALKYCCQHSGNDMAVKSSRVVMTHQVQQSHVNANFQLCQMKLGVPANLMSLQKLHAEIDLT